MKTIGWRERIDFPEWGVYGILAKSDTGAATGAVDTGTIKELDNDRVRFRVRTGRGLSEKITAKVSRRGDVRSAHGHAQPRVFVETTLRVGKTEKKVEIGLVCRMHMKCRVLLGRAALEGTFLVDSGRTYLLTSRRTKT
ncbi:MAG: RimK/LysX family protein [Planctomycetota bacterium]